MSPYAAPRLNILRLFHIRCGLKDGVLDLVHFAVLEGDTADAQLKVLQKEARIDGDNMGIWRMATPSS